MPKKKSWFQSQAEERLKGVKPVEFALDGPQKVKQVTIHSIYQKITLKFRFIKFFKEIGFVKFSISQESETHASKGTTIRRLRLFHRDSYPIDQYVNVEALVDQKNNQFKLVFTSNPNA